MGRGAEMGSTHPPAGYTASCPPKTSATQISGVLSHGSGETRMCTAKVRQEHGRNMAGAWERALHSHSNAGTEQEPPALISASQCKQDGNALEFNLFI